MDCTIVIKLINNQAKRYARKIIVVAGIFCFRQII